MFYMLAFLILNNCQKYVTYARKYVENCEICEW